MPLCSGGKTRGKDATPWTSTSLSIAKRLMKRVGDRWSRRFTTTVAYQPGRSLANVVGGERKKNSRKIWSRQIGSLYSYFPPRTRAPGLGFVEKFVLILSYINVVFAL